MKLVFHDGMSQEYRAAKGGSLSGERDTELFRAPFAREVQLAGSTQQEPQTATLTVEVWGSDPEQALQDLKRDAFLASEVESAYWTAPVSHLLSFRPARLSGAYRVRIVWALSAPVGVAPGVAVLAAAQAGVTAGELQPVTEGGGEAQVVSRAVQRGSDDAEEDLTAASSNNVTQVETVQYDGGTEASTHTVTYTPTAEGVLVLMFVIDNNNATLSAAPSGFTWHTQNQEAGASNEILYNLLHIEITSAMVGVQQSWDFSLSSTRRATAFGVLLDGVDTAAPIAQADLDIDLTDRTTVGAQVMSGISDGNGLVAMMAANDNAGATDLSISAANGFTQLVLDNTAANYQPNIYAGFRQKDGAGSQAAPSIDSDQAVGMALQLIEVAGDGSGGGGGTLAAEDDFEADTVGAGLPSGWANEWQAGDWSIADVGTDRSLMLDDLQSGGKGRRAASLTASEGLQNVDVLAVVQTDLHSTSHLQQNRVYARGGGTEGSETAVFVALHADDTLSVETYNSGSQVTLATPAFTWVANTWYALRLMVDGNNVRVKAWAPADPADPTADEPSAWTWEGQQTNVTASGWVGVGSFAANGARAWGDIEVIDLDTAAPGAMRLHDQTLEMYDASTDQQQLVGLRFDGVELPVGAEISDVRLRFRVGGDDAGTTGLALRIRCEAQDTGTFLSEDDNIANRTLTTASVTWTPASWNDLDLGTVVETPDLTALVQEVVGNGWAQGDALVFVIDEDPTDAESGASARRVAMAYDADPADAPEVRITYDTGTAPSFARQVAASLDDSQEQVGNGNIYAASTDVELGSDDVEGETVAGVRFRNVSVEQGEGVSEAYLRFTCQEAGSNAVVVRIHAEAADDGAVFNNTHGSGDLTGRTTTSAFVDWEIPAWSAGQRDADTTSPNLASLVQEVVDRAGWVSGNALVFLVSLSPNDTGAGSPPRRSAVAYDGEPSQAAELAINQSTFDGGDSGGGGGDTGDPNVGDFSLIANPNFSTTDLDDSDADASGRTQRDWYDVLLANLTEFRSWHTNGENRPSGRQGNADSTALLLTFRLYGDLALLDELAWRADAMYDAMTADADGFLAFDPGGQYDQELDAPMTAGLVAAIAWALYVNRDVTSPAGWDYEALALKWRDWLFNDYLPRWEGITGLTGQLPFIHKDQGHTFASNMRTLYYMGQFGGGGGHSAQDYFDAVESMLTEKLGDEHHCSAGFNGRTTKIWRHSVNGTSTDSEARQYTSYVRYEVPFYLEFWMEGIDPQSRITETWLTRVANSIADHILDGDPSATGNELASNIGGETTSDVCGVPYSDFRTRQTDQEWVQGGMMHAEGWDSRGRMTSEGLSMWASFAGDQGVCVPAARVFTRGFHDGLGPDLGGDSPDDSGYWPVPSAGVAPPTYPDHSFYASTRAFPGAEGWGANTTGGRGGVKCFVTTLTDDLSDLTAVAGVDNAYEGSFRACWEGRGLADNQARYIIPLVSGYMEATERIRTDWGLNDNWTYWGHFAPSPGLTIRYPSGTTPDYSLFDIRSSNFIVRFLRARGQASSGTDGNIDTVASWDATNFIYDHCSVSWGVDSSFDQREAKYTTVQWCLIYESLYDAGHPEGDHARLAGYGGSGDAWNISWHHNLSGASDIRNPSLDSIGEASHFENNFVYNCDKYTPIRNVHSPSGDPHSTNLRHNVAVNGPWGSAGDQPLFTVYEGAQFYVEDNFDNARTSSSDPQDACVEFTSGGGDRVTTPFDTPDLRVYEPFANAQLLIDRCGATRPARDAVDDDFLAQFQHGLDGYPNRGTMGSSTSSGNRPEDNLSFPALAENSITITSWVNDYEAWKTAEGYDGLGDNDTPITGSDYTVLELYANSLVPDM